MKRLFLSLLTLSLCGSLAVAGNDCKPIVAPVLPPSDLRVNIDLSSNAPINGTGGFIDLGESLIKEKLIGTAELRRLIESLEQGSVGNPFLFSLGMSTKTRFFYDLLQDYITKSHLDINLLLEWAQKRFAILEKNQEEKSRVQKATDTIHLGMIFNFIKKGSYTTSVGGRLKFVDINYDFEMTATAISQWQWVEVMGENPSEFVNGPDAIRKKVNGQWVSMQPDNPVESASWCSQLVFANRLSEKHGLTPAYDLSGLEIKEGRAEDGTLICNYGALKINSPDGKIGSTEGYRLPHPYEWVYVATGRGEIRRLYHFGNEAGELEKYAWFKENSNETTQPMGDLEPLVIDEQPFYDLHGNVQELTLNMSKSGRVGPAYMPLYGGSYANPDNFARIDSPGRLSGDKIGSQVGFRLVRALGVSPSSH